MFIKVEFLGGCPEDAQNPLLTPLDMILPEVFRAFAITKDSQYINLIAGRTHVAMTCILPGKVQVQHMTLQPVVIETYHLDDAAMATKVKSGTTYDG